MMMMAPMVANPMIVMAGMPMSMPMMPGPTGPQRAINTYRVLPISGVSVVDHYTTRNPLGAHPVGSMISISEFEPNGEYGHIVNTNFWIRIQDISSGDVLLWSNSPQAPQQWEVVSPTGVNVRMQPTTLVGPPPIGVLQPRQLVSSFSMQGDWIEHAMGYTKTVSQGVVAMWPLSTQCATWLVNCASAKGINVRSNPGLSSQVLGVVPNGVTIISSSSFRGWVRISQPNQFAGMYAKIGEGQNTFLQFQKDVAIDASAQMAVDETKQKLALQLQQENELKEKVALLEQQNEALTTEKAKAANEALQLKLTIKAGSAQTSWSCPSCTFINASTGDKCQMCQVPRAAQAPGAASPKSVALADAQSEIEKLKAQLKAAQESREKEEAELKVKNEQLQAAVGKQTEELIASSLAESDQAIKQFNESSKADSAAIQKKLKERSKARAEAFARKHATLPTFPDPPFTVAQLKEFYKKMDVDGTGTITKQQLEGLLVANKLDQASAKSYANDFFSQSDPAKNGFTLFEAFLAEYFRMQLYKVICNAYGKFDELDTNKDGTLSQPELMVYLGAQLGKEAAQEAITDCFEFLDADHTGGVTKEEFICWYFKKEGELQAVVANKDIVEG